MLSKYLRQISELSKTPIPKPVIFVPPHDFPDVAIGEPTSFCTTDGDPAAATEGC